MHSAIYTGTLFHTRHVPRRHAFSYEVFMAYVDLAELPGVFDCHPLWSARRPALAYFRREDYLGDPRLPLDEALRSLVAERLGRRPTGPIRMLTNLRMFGHCFNPVTFYYLFDPAGEEVEALVAEVTNTPWGERHAYVSEGRESVQPKALHVSPFMDPEGSYTWRAGLPGPELDIAIALHAGEERLFDATLRLERHAITRPELTRRLLGQAPMTLKVSAGIYAQALRLRAKGIRVRPHPKTPRPAAGTVHPAAGAPR